MAISSAGIGSNIDVNSLVSQLLALERRPLDRLVAQKVQFDSEITSYGTISSDLSAFQTALAKLKSSDSFKVFTASTGNSAYVTASAGSTATAGSHSLTITQLAQSQKLFSAAAFADTTTTTLGTGTLTIANGASSFAVTVDSSNNTLDGIVSAVNAAASNFGVSASIVNDGTGNRLLLSPNNTGTAFAVTVAVVDDDGINTDTSGLSQLSYTSGALNLSQTQAALNAIITVDGLAGITKASNTVTDVIQGVTLNLLTGGGVSTTVNVAVDTATLTANATEVVTAYNKLITNINSLRAKDGVLESDNTLLTIQSQLVGIFNTPAALSGNAYTYLAQIGISLQTDGNLAINTAEFENAVTSKFNDVVKLLSDPSEGVFQRLYNEAAALLQSNGVIDAKTDGITAQIDGLDTRIDQFEVRLVSVEARLRKQFSALDVLLGTLSSTGSLLSGRIGIF